VGPRPCGLSLTWSAPGRTCISQTSHRAKRSPDATFRLARIWFLPLWAT
jgi:hypothetical protein